ncbi:MAG: uncharacterized membrane protein YbaN (DUF454 family) [Parasphingorhabdus sp.]|jgi:uncharacterized membrane protein YbaN (DUF454 family)
MTRILLIILGWIFVLLGTIGVILPLLPTTPFLIVALFLFSRSSPRFHAMLLNNPWFGPGLRQWEETKTVSRQTKKKATLLIVITFAISIGVLYSRWYLQVMLFFLACVLLSFIWRLKETMTVVEGDEIQ